MTFFDPLIAAAKAGDDAAARVLLGLLAEYLERGEVPPPPLAAYFSEALRLIAGGRRAADDVLHIKGSRATDQRDYDIARAVWWLHHRPVDPLPLKDNRKRDGAYTIVAKKYGLNWERVKQIYLKMKNQFDHEVCEPPMIPEESRKLEVDMQIAFGQLAEFLKKRGNN
ncbi:hypothetical protein [Pseudomonas putida]|uniref:Uncharacterized protein n=1 Tax=Pseudomonas putida TaxID=303 RepID=A0AAW5HLE1_PSEPU|nr:hypothetical protein [Pseudomonas putida]MCO1621333.1 hypothetical protein [Pseudomonas putida]